MKWQIEGDASAFTRDVLRFVLDMARGGWTGVDPSRRLGSKARLVLPLLLLELEVGSGAAKSKQALAERLGCDVETILKCVALAESDELVRVTSDEMRRRHVVSSTGKLSAILFDAVKEWANGTPDAQSGRAQEQQVQSRDMNDEWSPTGWNPEADNYRQANKLYDMAQKLWDTRARDISEIVKLIDRGLSLQPNFQYLLQLAIEVKFAARNWRDVTEHYGRLRNRERQMAAAAQNIMALCNLGDNDAARACFQELLPDASEYERLGLERALKSTTST